MHKKIILASQSKQRLKVFKTLNLDFDIVSADLDEQLIKISDPAERAKKIARLKAEVVVKQYPKAIIISGDTYGFFNNEFFEKPKILEEAKEMLARLSGQNFQAFTGFCYLDLEKDLSFSTVKVMEVKMRLLSTKEIEHYVNTEPVLTWSAAFSPAYDSGAALIENFHGSYTSFTYGLPMEDVVMCLKKSEIL